MTLSTIAREQFSNLSVNQMLDYCATHPNTTIPYLNAPQSHSRVSGHFFLGCQSASMKPSMLSAPF
jgi:hypothetical protein